MEKKDVLHLAELSRIELSDEEIIKFQEDLSSILEYVDQIKEVGDSAGREESGVVHNVFREDEKPHEGGESREEIIGSFPDKEEGYLKVKKILS